MTKMTTGSHQDPSPTHLLGDYTFQRPLFPNLDQVLTALQSEGSGMAGAQIKTERVHEALYELINRSSEPCFLLPAVIDSIDQVKK